MRPAAKEQPKIISVFSHDFSTVCTELVEVRCQHLCEYLADAAKECTDDDEEKRKEWVDQQKARMKSGDVDSVLSALAPYRNGLPGKRANKSEECHRYLRANGDWDAYWRATGG